VAINVTPIPGLDPDINDLRRRTADFINAEVLPMEEMLWQSRRGADLTEDARESNRRRSIELREEIKAGVNKAGLWAYICRRSTGAWGLTFYRLPTCTRSSPTPLGRVHPVRHRCTQFWKRQHPREIRHRRAEAPVATAPHRKARWVGFLHDRKPDHAGSDPRSIETEGVPRRRTIWVIPTGIRWCSPPMASDANFLLSCAGPTIPGWRIGDPRPDDPDHRPHRYSRREYHPGYPASSAHDTVRPLRDQVRERTRSPSKTPWSRWPGPTSCLRTGLGAGRVYHCMNSVGQMWRLSNLMVERTFGSEVHGGAQRQAVHPGISSRELHDGNLLAS